MKIAFLFVVMKHEYLVLWRYPDSSQLLLQLIRVVVGMATYDEFMSTLYWTALDKNRKKHKFENGRAHVRVLIQETFRNEEIYKKLKEEEVYIQKINTSIFFYKINKLASMILLIVEKICHQFFFRCWIFQKFVISFFFFVEFFSHVWLECFMLL